MGRRARSVAFSSRRVRGSPVAVIRRNRRAIPGSLLRHLCDLRVRNFQSVLDRIAPTIQSTLQSDSVVRMARNFFLPPMRFIHDGLQLFYGQRGLRNQISLLVHPGTMGHINLDPVRSMLQLLAGGFSGFYWPVYYLRSFLHFLFWCVVLLVVIFG